MQNLLHYLMSNIGQKIFPWTLSGVCVYIYIYIYIYIYGACNIYGAQ